MEKIFITCGDINGIGNELIIKTFRDIGSHSGNAVIIVGNKNIFYKTMKLSHFEFNNDITDISINDISIINDPGFYFLNINIKALQYTPGEISSTAGELSGKAIVTAVKLARKHNGILLTAPINKISLNLGGYNYPGHTEFISELLGSDGELMILDGEMIRVALVTTHLAISEVPGKLTKEKIVNKGKMLLRSLQQDYAIKSPRITVCSLNPHASDGGLFGSEEKEIISPAVSELNSFSANADPFTGPVSPDTAFTKSYLENTDAYLVMYHDQGLIPLKVLSFGNAVNFTAGLPVVRTSPDHGTAYDIAGSFEADNTSFRNAFFKGIEINNNRKKLSNPIS